MKFVNIFFPVIGGVLFSILLVMLTKEQPESKISDLVPGDTSTVQILPRFDTTPGRVQYLPFDSLRFSFESDLIFTYTETPQLIICQDGICHHYKETGNTWEWKCIDHPGEKIIYHFSIQLYRL